MNGFSSRTSGRSASTAGDPASTVAMALPIVERLRQTIEAENEDIARRGPVDYEAYGLRKNKALLELNRLASARGGAAPCAPLRAALAELQTTLELNQRLLGVQLKACAAVSEIIARAIGEGQSDGTYTAQTGSRGDE